VFTARYGLNVYVAQINIIETVFTTRYGLNLHVVQINIYNRDGECLLRGTVWIFMWSRLIFITQTECIYCAVRAVSLG